jgi:hypothetical protein
MLNGSKTYLISFTALFNKKGYELALGVDTLIDVLRDTQYHLTAPAYSTYNTLKLDVMKTATKSPYSATSLFGNGLREALISTEMEGVGIETVHANIVSYLSEIQRHFSGESRVDTRSSTQYTYSERVDKEFARLDIEVKAESISDALLEATDVAETILNAEYSNFSLADNVRNIEINDMTFNAQNDMTYETSIEEDIESNNVTLFNSDSSDVSSGGEKVEVVWDTEHSSEESATMSDGESALIPLAIGTVRVTDIKDALINSFESGVYDHVYELERIEQSSPSKLYQGHLSDIADFTPVDYDSRGRRAWVDYTTLADSGVDVDSAAPDWLSIGSTEEKYLQADVGESTDAKKYGDIEDGLIGESKESNLLYHSEGSAPLEFTSCSNEFQMDAEVQEMSAAKLIKDVIADSPEVGRMARLLEIMYGHKAFEMIQAGMNNLVDSYVQDKVTADPISITDAVIQQLEEALGNTTVYTDNASMEHGVLDSHRDGACDTIEGGEKNTGYEGTLQNIGEAMSAADNRILSMQETETGFIFNFDEGVSQDIERANSENSIGSVVAETEIAEVSTQYESIDQPIESATWTAGFDAVENDESVQVEGGNSSYETVDSPIEQSSKYTSNVAVEESTVFAGQEITVEAITAHDEHADHVSITMESIEHKLESAVAGKGNEATLAEVQEMSAAKLIKDVIAESPEVGRMASLLGIMYGHKAFEMIQAGMDNLVDSYVQDMETADPVSITNAVIQHLEEALGGTTVYTDNASMEHGVLDSHRDSVYDTIEGGEKNTGYEGTLQNIGEAMSAADNRISSMQETETGFILNFNEGVSQDIERGNSKNSVGAVIAETETADSSMSFDSGKSEETETAMVSTQYESIDQSIESATWAVEFDTVQNDESVQAEGGNSSYESVDSPIEQGGKYTSNVAVEESTVFAGQEITVEAITAHDEHADHVSTTMESIEHKLESAVAGKGNEATLAEDEGAMGAISYEAVNSDYESAYIEGGNTLSIVEEQEQGQLSGGPIESVVDEGIGAEAITVTEFADVSHITEGSRKRRVIPTNIENAGESTRTKVIETVIAGVEEGARVKEAIPTEIENVETGQRPHKVIETTIEKPSEASMLTPEAPKKPKIWLILGKVASWSIWNWKKTR